MTQVTVTSRQQTSRGPQSLAQGLRRVVVGTIAALALIVAYGVTFIGAQVASTIGITGLTLATTATAAQADRRRGGRGGRDGRRRRQGRRRHRRWRGGGWQWYYVPYWYYW
jgi:hypothetical protein